MKIGDKVYIRGTVDEIRKDVVIIKNEGGYFGTVESEICAVTPLTALESLESEYNAYHNGNDYWCGIRYALDVIEGVNNG